MNQWKNLDELSSWQKVAGSGKVDLTKAMAGSNRYKNLKLDSVSPYYDGKTDTNIVCVNIA